MSVLLTHEGWFIYDRLNINNEQVTGYVEFKLNEDATVFVLEYSLESLDENFCSEEFLAHKFMNFKSLTVLEDANIWK